MELTGKLNDEMSKAKDKDEANEIMENAGMKLTDDELDTVAGGQPNSIERLQKGSLNCLAMKSQVTYKSVDRSNKIKTA